MVPHKRMKMSWVNMLMHFSLLYGEGSTIPVNVRFGLFHPVQAKYNIILGDWYDWATERDLYVSNLGTERFCLLSDWCASIICHDDSPDTSLGALDRTIFPHHTKKSAQKPAKPLNSLEDLAHTIDERFVLAYLS
ncbi:hypothetical protein DSO57_1029710 [Entomophthora muscae]|uniref:Uncharacterized protein n=1 Tax=Entomophthora muscae TaxID=34485 RepID=A0ACC2RS17_9FUNG|nr:hypothetical protein DSO57_1029710 [Entomophthora muscae]